MKPRTLQWARHVASIGRGEMYNFGGKHLVKRSLRRKWEDNIKLDLREVTGDDDSWMELA
jgi:hypothetical protein